MTPALTFGSVVPICVLFGKAGVSKVIEVRDLEEFNKETIDAKLSAF
jgi:hypothetical protein